MVLVAVEPHISSPGKAGGISRRLINKSDQLFMISQKVARSFDPSLSLFEYIRVHSAENESRIFVAPAFRYPTKGSISILDRCRKTDLPSVKAENSKSKDNGKKL